MPELPEVEVTRRGLVPLLTEARLLHAEFPGKPLRWRPHPYLARHVAGQIVHAVARRGKYLLLEMASGWLLIHLGMSGRVQCVTDTQALGPWDHFDLRFQPRRGPYQRLRLTDPRRFGAVLWHSRADGPIEKHPLLAHLGIEPFDPHFNAMHLHQRWQGRSVSVKQALLAGHDVVGVGNIYASESLFHAGIRPQTAVKRLSVPRCTRLVDAIRQVLSAAIERGGSTLRDFADSHGKTGYFQLDYYVYGRAGQPCRVCGTTVRTLKQGQRSSFYCPKCQR